MKLEPQLLSQSVTDALKFCKDSLKQKEFSSAGATVQIIEFFNIIFDILNSRSVNCVKFNNLCLYKYDLYLSYIILLMYFLQKRL